MAAELKNVDFKESFVQFLISNWTNSSHKAFIGNKTIYIDFLQCHKLQVVNENIEMTIPQDLCCPHQEEADTRIVFHVSKITYECDVTIRCSDTDILIILLGNMAHMDTSIKINMHVGTGNNQSHINVTNLYKTLGAELANSLPAFHAFTGCDYNPTFYGKGKNRPLKLLRQSKKFLKAFTDIVHYPNCSDTVFDTIEEFVCRMYNWNTITRVNEARVAAFYKAYDWSTDPQLTKSKMKHFDASSLPPCRAELRPHIRRSAYIAKIWTNAHSQDPLDLNATDSGWALDDESNKLEFAWFDGNQLPESITDITQSCDQEISKLQYLHFIKFESVQQFL